MNAIIIEDEKTAVRNLQTLLREVSPEIQIIEVLDCIEDSVRWLKIHNEHDMIFMDIHLADGSAFEIFDKVRVDKPVIFTTAYDEYALKAFKVNSIDYLLKPIDLDSLRQALDKFQVLSQPKEDMEQLLKTFKALIPRQYKTNFLILSQNAKLIPLDAKDIACIRIESGVVEAFTFNEKHYRIDETLEELSDTLDPKQFFRANRQYIISRKAIKDIDLWFNNRLSVNLYVPVDDKILVNKPRVAEFKRWYIGK
ncbi:MAG: LytTR family DNA-binding domain-containing protein [Bacteroidales bacterium]|jgi:two-component system LytT family response regulator|nr:LytTR family DNA-binding domain-containing protein [Bacteroidales bacterium]